MLRSRRANAHLFVRFNTWTSKRLLNWNPIPKLTIVLIWKTPASLKFGNTSNRAVENLLQRKLWVWTANDANFPVFLSCSWRNALWLNAMYCGKMYYCKLSRNFVGAIRTTTINCRVSFTDLYLVFPRNLRIVFLPHTNTVILLEPYRGTITEPGLPVHRHEERIRK